MKYIDGRRFLTTGEAASVLQVSGKTLIRWAEESGRSNRPARVEGFQDPISGRHYWSEVSVEGLHRLMTNPARVDPVEASDSTHPYAMGKSSFGEQRHHDTGDCGMADDPC